MTAPLTPVPAQPTDPIHLASHFALTEVRDHRMVVVIHKYVGGLEVVSKYSKKTKNAPLNVPEKRRHTFKSP